MHLPHAWRMTSRVSRHHCVGPICGSTSVKGPTLKKSQQDAVSHIIIPSYYTYDSPAEGSLFAWPRMHTSQKQCHRKKHKPGLGAHLQNNCCLLPQALPQCCCTSISSEAACAKRLVNIRSSPLTTSAHSRIIKQAHIRKCKMHTRQRQLQQ